MGSANAFGHDGCCRLGGALLSILRGYLPTPPGPRLFRPCRLHCFGQTTQGWRCLQGPCMCRCIFHSSDDEDDACKFVLIVVRHAAHCCNAYTRTYSLSQHVPALAIGLFSQGNFWHRLFFLMQTFRGNQFQSMSC